MGAVQIQDNPLSNFCFLVWASLYNIKSFPLQMETAIIKEFQWRITPRCLMHLYIQYYADSIVFSPQLNMHFMSSYSNYAKCLLVQHKLVVCWCLTSTCLILCSASILRLGPVSFRLLLCFSWKVYLCTMVTFDFVMRAALCLLLSPTPL